MSSRKGVIEKGRGFDSPQSPVIDPSSCPLFGTQRTFSRCNRQSLQLVVPGSIPGVGALKSLESSKHSVSIPDPARRASRRSVVIPDRACAHTCDFTVVTKVGHLRYDLGRPFGSLRVKTTSPPGGYRSGIRSAVFRKSIGRAGV